MAFLTAVPVRYGENLWRPSVGGNSPQACARGGSEHNPFVDSPACLRDGVPPYEVARRVTQMVGMTTRQIQAAENYRATLVDLGLSPAKVKKSMARYIKKKIRQRANNIARTEVMTALNRGVARSWVQARKEGYLTTKQVAEIIVTPDDRVCPVCEPLDGVQVPIDDFSAHPSFHSSCRCTVGIVDKR